jgi:hypothetical protein
MSHSLRIAKWSIKDEPRATLASLWFEQKWPEKQVVKDSTFDSYEKSKDIYAKFTGDCSGWQRGWAVVAQWKVKVYGLYKKSQCQWFMFH